jgi:pimeloyl-ACP methyl ester carboxylesterase
MPYLCYFQGGPGFQSPVPEEGLAWLSAACKNFRVILLDQRGTGKSTPVRTSTLEAVGDVAAQVGYLRNFRVDSIIKDAEQLRLELLKGKRWSILGQSFGGFCCVQYLSTAPSGAFRIWSGTFVANLCWDLISIETSLRAGIFRRHILI